jgi:hypothetical protein
METLLIYTNNGLSALVNISRLALLFILGGLEGDGWIGRKSQEMKPVAAYYYVFPLKVALRVKMLSSEQRELCIWTTSVYRKHPRSEDVYPGRSIGTSEPKMKLRISWTMDGINKI